MADRFFEICLLGLVLSGYLAVLGSGYLDLPTVVLTAAALLLRVLLAVRLVRFELSRRTVAAITVAYIGFYLLDYAFVSGEILRATVHLVCFLAVIKVLTAKTARDYVHVKMIAFLQLLAAAVLSTNLSFFLFLALFVVFGVATFTSAEIHRSTRNPVLTARGGLERFHVRLAALSLLIAVGILSLTACLFFLLPRTAHAAFQHLVSRPYHLPGFSNEVILGQIGELLQRNTPVMRVRSADRSPLPALKWRGAALSNFDGKRWFNPGATGRMLPVEKGWLILADDAQRRRAGSRITYEVHLKGIASDVLFFAGIPEVLRINTPGMVRKAADAYRLGYRAGAGLYYVASSFIEADGTLSEYSRQSLSTTPPSRYLQLPALDPRIHALARKIAGGLNSDQARALATETYLRRNYSYTTELPSKEVADPLAYFLFERRKGHCEYYASAMAVTLRTLGIPSRLVTGFHSGVLNPISGWHVVRASDAHSWVEAWLPGRGWSTFDPTPPDPMSQRPSFWARLNFYLDAAEMFWQDWVVNYDLEQQLTLATKMGSSSRGFGSRWLDRLRSAGLGSVSRLIHWLKEYGMTIVALVLISVVFWLYGPRAWRWWTTRQRLRRLLHGKVNSSDAGLLYTRMLELLRRRGVEKPPWLTPAEFARLLPPSETAALVGQLTLAYNELRYGGNLATAPRITGLLEQLERL
jgi:hypothetical protein